MSVSFVVNVNARKPLQVVASLRDLGHLHARLELLKIVCILVCSLIGLSAIF